VIIRHARFSERAELQELHKKMQSEYELPRHDVSAVVEIDERLRAAALMRRTSEMYLLIDPEYGSTRDKLSIIAALHHALVAPARLAGFTDTHAWLPPSVEPRFGDLLVDHFGWRRPSWTCYHREVK